MLHWPGLIPGLLPELQKERWYNRQASSHMAQERSQKLQQPFGDTAAVHDLPRHNKEGNAGYTDNINSIEHTPDNDAEIGRISHHSNMGNTEHSQRYGDGHADTQENGKN